MHNASIKYKMKKRLKIFFIFLCSVSIISLSFNVYLSYRLYNSSNEKNYTEIWQKNIAMKPKFIQFDTKNTSNENKTLIQKAEDYNDELKESPEYKEQMQKEINQAAENYKKQKNNDL